MPLVNNYSFKSCDGKHDIHVREWTPDTQPVGVLQIIHGVAETIERYDAFANFMNENGFVVVGTDHLGHGQSISCQEDLGYFAENGGWEYVVGDERKLYESMKETYPGIPSFILGHSMGSFIVRTFAITYHDGPDGIIVCGTGFPPAPLLFAGLTLSKLEKKRKGGMYRSALVDKAAFGSYNKKISNPRTEKDWLTTDSEIVDKYIADPLCGFMPTVGLFYDMFSAIKYVCDPKNISRVDKNLPVFLIAGNDDPVGDYGKGVQRCYSAYLTAGLNDVTMKLYKGARHELLNEYCKEDAYNDILSWINSKRR